MEHLEWKILSYNTIKCQYLWNWPKWIKLFCFFLRFIGCGVHVSQSWLQTFHKLFPESWIQTCLLVHLVISNKQEQLTSKVNGNILDKDFEQSVSANKKCWGSASSTTTPNLMGVSIILTKFLTYLCGIFRSVGSCNGRKSFFFVFFHIKLQWKCVCCSRSNWHLLQDMNKVRLFTKFKVAL